MLRSLAIAPLCAALLLLCACGDSDGGDSQNNGGNGDNGDLAPDGGPIEPWIEIGTGARRFAPLTDQQEVPIIMGIQGGYHVWGGLRGQGFAPDELRLSYTLKHNDEVVARANYVDDLRRGRSGFYEYAAVAVVLIDNGIRETIDGQVTRLEVEIVDADARRLSDSIEVIPKCCE